MMYSPIRTCDDVKKLREESAAESATLDFKTEVRPSEGENGNAKRIEFVRDVIQFANAGGGTLLIGFRETISASGIKTIGDHIPLSDCNARRDWIHTAVKDFAIPNTLSFDIVDIEIPSGFVTAVNVPPHPGTVFIWDKQNIQCVVRSDRQKKYLNPEEALHHVANNGRVMKLALQRVLTEGAKTDVELASGLWTIAYNVSAGIIETGDGYGGHPEVLVRVPREGTKLRMGPRHEQVFVLVDERRRNVNVPYSLIRDVWTTEFDTIGLLLAAKLVRYDEGIEIQA